MGQQDEPKRFSCCGKLGHSDKKMTGAVGQVPEV